MCDQSTLNGTHIKINSKIRINNDCIICLLFIVLSNVHRLYDNKIRVIWTICDQSIKFGPDERIYIGSTILKRWHCVATEPITWNVAVTRLWPVPANCVYPWNTMLDSHIGVAETALHSHIALLCLSYWTCILVVKINYLIYVKCG